MRKLVNKGYRYEKGGPVRDADEMLARQRAVEEPERFALEGNNPVSKLLRGKADAVDKADLGLIDERNRVRDYGWKKHMSKSNAEYADMKSRSKE